MAAQMAPLLLEAIGKWAPAQAAFGAVAAVLVCEAHGKRATSLVAAAARGIAQGLSVEARPIEEQEEILGILGVQSVGKAVSSVREAGHHELAKRIQRRSKGRNCVAHPDVGLMDDVKQFASKEAMKLYELGRSEEHEDADTSAAAVGSDLLPPVPPFPSLSADRESEVKQEQAEDVGQFCEQGEGELKEMVAVEKQESIVEGEAENEINAEGAWQKLEQQEYSDGYDGWRVKKGVPFSCKRHFWSIHKTVPKRFQSQARLIQNRFIQAIQANNAQGVEEATAELKALRGW